MADLSKLTFVNANNDLEESKEGDSLKYTSYKTASYELTDYVLGQLVNGADTRSLATVSFETYPGTDTDNWNGTLGFNGNTDKLAMDYASGATPKSIKKIDLDLEKDGSPSGSLRVGIYADNSGTPDIVSGALATSDTLDVSTMTTDVRDTRSFTFSSAYTLSASTQYWFVLEIVSGSGFGGGSRIKAYISDQQSHNYGIAEYDGSVGTWSGSSGQEPIYELYEETYPSDIVALTNTDGYLDQSFLQYNVNFGNNKITADQGLQIGAEHLQEADAERLIDGLQSYGTTAVQSYSQTGDGSSSDINSDPAYISEEFVPAQDMTISSAKFKFSKTGSPTGHLQLEVFTGASDPGSANNQVANAKDQNSVDVSNFGTSAGEVEFTLDGPVTLNSGQTYFFKFSWDDFYHPAPSVDGSNYVSYHHSSSGTHWVYNSGWSEVTGELYMILLGNEGISDVSIFTNSNGYLDQSFLQYNIDFGSNKLSGVSNAAASSDAVPLGQLDSNANGEGASLIGIEDSGGLIDATNVEGALAELAAKKGGVEYQSGEALSKGDPLYISSSDGKVYKLGETDAEIVIGLAANSTAGADEAVTAVANDEVLTGMLGFSSQDPGTRVFWTAATNSWATTMPTNPGTYIWMGGVVKNGADVHVQVRFIKKNA